MKVKRTGTLSYAEKLSLADITHKLKVTFSLAPKDWKL